MSGEDRGLHDLMRAEQVADAARDIAWAVYQRACFDAGRAYLEPFAGPRPHGEARDETSRAYTAASQRYEAARHATEQYLGEHYRRPAYEHEHEDADEGEDA